MSDYTVQIGTIVVVLVVVVGWWILQGREPFGVAVVEPSIPEPSVLVPPHRCSCGKSATHPEPRIVQAWFDAIPVLAWFNRLFGLPLRQRVEVPVYGAPVFCEAHAHLAVQEAERELAQTRAESSRFNMLQQARIAELNNGGLRKRIEVIVLDSRAEIERQYAKRIPMASRPAEDTALRLPEASSDENELPRIDEVN